jgi:DNA-binding transcriptional LysR family regulator
VVLRLLDGPAAGVVGEIANGNADLAIAAAESFAGHKVKISPLVKDRFIAIVPVGHRCSGTPWMTWAELAADPFITLEPDAGARALAEAAFAKAGMTAPSLIEARNVSTIAGLVAAGLGVCAMSAMVGRLMSFADVAMVPLVEPTVERELSIIEPAANTNNPAAQSFIEVLQTMRRNDVPLPLGVSWLPEAA